MDNTCKPHSRRSKTVSSAASYLRVWRVYCEKGPLPAQTDGCFTHMHTHTHTYNGSQIAAFTACYKGEPPEHTHPCLGKLPPRPVLNNCQLRGREKKGRFRWMDKDCVMEENAHKKKERRCEVICKTPTGLLWPTAPHWLSACQTNCFCWQRAVKTA